MALVFCTAITFTCTCTCHVATVFGFKGLYMDITLRHGPALSIPAWWVCALDIHTFYGLDDFGVQLLVLELAPWRQRRLCQRVFVPETVHQLSRQLRSSLCLPACLLQPVGQDVDT